MENPKIKRVLISVTDKTGVVEFATKLQQEFGATIISTGGTAKALEAGGVQTVAIDDVTGFPEMMDGRVKTLHPKVHGGLLARRDNPAHMEVAAAHGIEMIDMVVVNLYAFDNTVQSGADFETCIENIDIGGPSMLRSAAKNFESVAVVTAPETYDAIIEEMRANDGATTRNTRLKLASDVFIATCEYDGSIAFWLEDQVAKITGHSASSCGCGCGCDAHLNDSAEEQEEFPAQACIDIDKVQDLRYGENPHQKAAFYSICDYENAEFSLARAKKLQGKELSYNNYLDLDAAWAAVREYSDPSCVIIKHLTPCGVCTSSDVVSAYIAAHECDSISAFGGVMAFNREVSASLVQAIFDNKQFVEAIVAPSFEAGALELYATKPNARLLETGGINPAGNAVEFRSVEGGLLCQDSDSAQEDPKDFTCATNRKPSEEEMEELIFAWKACKSVKSNAIFISKNKTSVGVGGGQPNRVNSARIAVTQAGEAAKGAVAASDAFFPFADGLLTLAEAGVTAVIQPGGSVRDEEIIAACNENNIAMVFTGHRHFRH